jgi:hypothetical protein
VLLHFLQVSELRMCVCAHTHTHTYINALPVFQLLQMLQVCIKTHFSLLKPQVADGGDGLQIWRVAANILYKQLRTAEKGCPSSLEVGEGVTTQHHKK